jgi:hypothetical protein
LPADACRQSDLARTAASWRRRTSTWQSFAMPVRVPSAAKQARGNADARRSAGCTRIDAESTLAHVRPAGRASAPSACILLICVHLRFPLLLPEQARGRRRGTIVILGRREPDRVQRIWLNNRATLCQDVTLPTAGDQVLAVVWLRPTAALGASVVAMPCRPRRPPHHRQWRCARPATTTGSWPRGVGPRVKTGDSGGPWCGRLPHGTRSPEARCYAPLTPPPPPLPPARQG